MTISVHKPLNLHSTQRKILELIRSHAPVTRAELSRLSKLTGGTITQQCRELIFQGLVIEGEPNKGQRGQPSLPLKLNPGGACSVGVSFSPGFIDISMVDFCGHKLFSASQQHIESQPLANTMQQIKLLIDEILKKKKLRHARILGIGYAVPGFIRHDKKRQVVSWLSHWQDVDLYQEFSTSLPWPTWIENNANSSAIGEFYRGEWPNCHDLTSIDLGYGIGAGVIANQKLLRGGFGNAGEIGIAFPGDKQRPSLMNLLSTLREHELDVENLANLLAIKHPVVEKWIDRCCEQVEQTVMGCIQWLDPQIIILGGRMPPSVLQIIVDTVNENIGAKLDEFKPTSTLVVSKMGIESASWGAAMIPLYQILNSEE